MHEVGKILKVGKNMPFVVNSSVLRVPTLQAREERVRALFSLVLHLLYDISLPLFPN